MKQRKIAQSLMRGASYAMMEKGLTNKWDFSSTSPEELVNTAVQLTSTFGSHDPNFIARRIPRDEGVEVKFCFERDFRERLERQI